MKIHVVEILPNDIITCYKITASIVQIQPESSQKINWNKQFPVNFMKKKLK